MMLSGIYLTLAGQDLFAGSAREMVAGPGSIALFNSSYRAAIADPLNALTKDIRIGSDFRYHIMEQKNSTDQRKWSGIDTHIYGMIPLFNISGKARPSGLFFRVLSLQNSGSGSGLSSYNELANGSDVVEKNTRNEYHIGTSIALENSWMFSLNLIHVRIQASLDEQSVIALSNREEQNLYHESQVGSMTYPEYGLKVKLSRDTSVAVQYSEGFSNRSGQTVAFRNQFLDSEDTGVLARPLYQPGSLTTAFKTRILRETTLTGGIRKSFAVDVRRDDGQLIKLAKEFSSLGISLEHRFKFAGKTWFPGLGLRTMTDKTNEAAFGLGIRAGLLDFDLALIQTIKNDPDDKRNQFSASMGLGYRFGDSAKKKKEKAKVRKT
ncbi:MAG: hypothetical protein H6618_06905 [Deltaproteobacteria bacterium]|nr:hypothetical protein [Deltaproteobacteria bacterium]